MIPEAMTPYENGLWKSQPYYWLLPQILYRLEHFPFRLDHLYPPGKYHLGHFCYMLFVDSNVNYFQVCCYHRSFTTLHQLNLVTGTAYHEGHAWH